jgi:methionine synthase I (cobalamin-dependent)
MSVEYLKAAAAAGESDKLIRFVRLHVGDGNEAVGKRELDKSWIEAIKILLEEGPVDRDLIETVMAGDEATMALLYFHLHFHLVRHSGEWIHDGSQ